MSQQDDSTEKSHEPTPRKLEQARRKGDIPRAPDMLTGFAYLGLYLACLIFGAGVFRTVAEGLLPFIEQPDRMIRALDGRATSPFAGALLQNSVLPTAPIFVMPMVLVMLTLIASRGLIFSAAKLAPKFSRISPIENAKNKYGPRGLFEFLKSFLKLGAYSGCLALFLSTWARDISGLSRVAPTEVMVFMLGLVVQFLALATVIALAIGVIDFFWQRAEHLRKNRMSQKELRDELKESEGDPHVKQHRRSRGQEIALNQMLADVPEADVVIVNPTHFAVALKWSRLPGAVPACVAKGQDEIAARIRETAQQHGVPIHSDPPTARALFATTQIGQEIDPDLYRPVAAAIRFAEAMRKRAKPRKTL